MSEWQTQAERTALAWRRTLIGFLAVAGIGAVHLITLGRPDLAAGSGAVALVAAIPIWHRLARLQRHRYGPALHEIRLVAACAVLLALGVALLFWNP